MGLLVLNAGSSNLKASVFNCTDGKLLQSKPVWTKKIEWRESDLKDCEEQICSLLNDLPQNVEMVGHRIVHGGDKYFSSTLITNEVIADLKELIELAPLHEPISIIGIECAKRILGDVEQVAVFDTAFHSTMPEASKIYALPLEWYQKYKIHRFGFHGISHRYATLKAASILQKSVEQMNLIVCHLGNGASLCAVFNGKSVFTTMGYTPLDGIMMGTRCGSMDPGIILHLLKNKSLSVEQIETALNEKSGLMGICGNSNMQEVEQLVSKGDEKAILALEIYRQKLCSAIFSLLAYFEQLPDLVFTGGIGENSSFLRQAVCEKLELIGYALNSDLNIKNQMDSILSSKQTSAKILVIQSKEDLAIAEECVGIFSASS
ncbi:acetate/propionate family kinase [bacterium]|nr:acetate/propionate family kinase [bacterium]